MVLIFYKEYANFCTWNTKKRNYMLKFPSSLFCFSSLFPSWSFQIIYYTQKEQRVEVRVGKENESNRREWIRVLVKTYSGMLKHVQSLLKHLILKWWRKFCYGSEISLRFQSAVFTRSQSNFTESLYSIKYLGESIILRGEIVCIEYLNKGNVKDVVLWDLKK